MKFLTPLSVVFVPLLLIGCSSTSPFTIEEHGAPIAQSIGTDVSDLKYIAPGDFVPIDQLSDGFSPATKGLVALTATSIFWREGQEHAFTPNAFREIPLTSVTGAVMDRGLLQLEIDQEVHVLRITQWNPYQESVGQALEFLELLRQQNVPEFAYAPRDNGQSPFPHIRADPLHQRNGIADNASEERIPYKSSDWTKIPGEDS
ncbi:MAG: hypothetical protein SynsKO_21120 [Synoicihabitans sp.]